MCMCVQSYPVLWDFMDCSSVHGFFQAKNTRMACHFLLWKIVPIQGSNPRLLRLLRLLHWQADSLQLSHLGSSQKKKMVYVKSIFHITQKQQLSKFHSKSQQTQDSRKVNVSVWVWMQEKADVPSQCSQGRAPAFSAFLVYSCLRLTAWGPHTLRRAICFTLSTDSNVKVIKKTKNKQTKKNHTLTEISRIMSEQTYGYPMAQASWLVNLTITVHRKRVIVLITN